MNGHVQEKDNAQETLNPGIKRSLSQSEQANLPAKRPRIVGPKKHRLRHAQILPSHIEPASQDESFAQSQLLRAISIAVSDAGFASIKASALEAFRASAEEYVLHILFNVKRFMNSCRRTDPIPHDFTSALAAEGVALSSLLPRRKQRIPVEIVQPPIPPPPLDEPPLPSFDVLLGFALTGDADRLAKKYIPPHCPPLPSKHTYQHTPIFTAREKDQRSIREQATREGVLAEKALRKLMAASEAGRAGTTNGFLAERHGAKHTHAEQIWEETMEALAQDDEAGKGGSEELEIDFGGDGAVDTRHKAGGRWRVLDEGLLVNYDTVHWMKGGLASASKA